MFKQIILISLVAVFSISMLFAKKADVRAEGHDDIVTHPVDYSGLRSTLLFSIYGPERIYADPDDATVLYSERARAFSLGTVINVEGTPIVITHDHWSLDDDKWEEVAISGADGRLLMTMTVAAFRNLILFQDGGTMTLRLPAQLEEIAIWAPYSSAAQVSPGTMVDIVYRQPDGEGVTAMKAVVEEVTQHQGISSYVLRSTTGQAIIPGDSGGGIFLSGQLIANNWTTLIKTVEVANELMGFTLSTSLETVQDSSRAAALTNEVLGWTAERLTLEAAPATLALGPG